MKDIIQMVKDDVDLNIDKFINNFYSENKDLYDCLIDKEFIIKKSNDIFYRGVWKRQLMSLYTYNFDKNKILFGLKSGVFVYSEGMIFHSNRENINFNSIKFNSVYDTYHKKIHNLNSFLKYNRIEINDGQVINSYGEKFLITSKEQEVIIKFLNQYIDLVENIFKKLSLEEQKSKKVEFEKKQESLNNKKINLISILDKDGNGEVDLVDGESFNKLLTKNQSKIIEIDKNYIQKFVKISMYLKTKKSNTQKIFDSIKNTKNDTKLNELVNLLQNQIHTYELLVFHSINMITSLVESDLITFYEIYECFDQLGVFNSNWESEVSNKLTDIGDGIKDLMYSIYQMENKIVNSINNLTYVTQDSFRDLNRSVNNQLSSIDSSIKFNNLLTGIQTYQMYKINQNTKRIG